MRWKCWSLRYRIFVSYGIVLAPAIALVGLLLLRLLSIDSDLERLNYQLIIETDASAQVVSQVTFTQQAIDTYLQSPTGETLLTAQQAFDQLDHTLTTNRLLLNTPKQVERLDTLIAHLSVYRHTFGTLSTVIEQRRATATQLDEQLFLASASLNDALNSMLPMSQRNSSLLTGILLAQQQLQLASLWSARLLTTQSQVAADNALIRLDAVRSYLYLYRTHSIEAPSIRMQLRSTTTAIEQAQQTIPRLAREGSQMQELRSILLDEQGVRLLSQAQLISVEAQKRLTSLAANLNQQSSQAFQSTVVALLLTLVLGMALGLWLAQTITHPLRELVAASDQLRHGKYMQPSFITDQSDIGRLATAFDDLVLTLRWQHEQLAQHRTELENQVAERTDELSRTQRALYQTQKLEAVGRLAGGIAHDFNNVLTVVQGSCELLNADLEEESELRVEVAQIQQATQHAAALIRQMFAFSRQQTLKPQLLDLSVVVHGIEPLLRRAAGSSVTIRTNMPLKIGHVYADRSQIEQVLMNLVLNARDAMPAGGTITIQLEEALDVSFSAASIAPSRHAVVLSVRDTGTGIDEATLAQIFEPFFTTKGEGKGSGLGLATVHGIVMQSGGQIDVWSSLGHGTIFTIYLPYVEAEPSLAHGAAQLLPDTEVPTMQTQR